VRGRKVVNMRYMNVMTILVQRNKIYLKYINKIHTRDNPHSTHTYESTGSRFFKEKSTMTGQNHLHHVDIFLITAGRSHVQRIL
jgi:hypothetical protein